MLAARYRQSLKFAKQSLTYLTFNFQGPLVQPSTLLDVSGSVPQEVVLKLLTACKTNSFAKIQAEVSDSIADGWPVGSKAQIDSQK